MVVSLSMDKRMFTVIAGKADVLGPGLSHVIFESPYLHF